MVGEFDDVRHTYIIGGNTMETADRRLRNGCHVYHEFVMISM